MRVLPLAFILLPLIVGCQYDPYAHLFTTEKPQSADVVGRYSLTKQTVVAGGLSAMKGQSCCVELRADGTFTAANVPPWDGDSPGTTFFDELRSGTGTWRIDNVGSVDDGHGPLKTHWGIHLDVDSHVRLRSAGLTGKKPPYGLIFTLGDPDSGMVMILERN